MGTRSTILIIVLVFGILFSLLSVVQIYQHGLLGIPNKPAILQVQAFESVKRYLQANASSFQGIMMQSGIVWKDGYPQDVLLSDSEFIEQGKHLPLVYFHRNLTVYTLEADPLTGAYKIIQRCDGNENINCLYPRDERDRAPLMGKLVYEVGGMQFLYKTRNAGESTYRWEYFVVDASNGDVLYTTFDCNEKRPQWCK